MISFDFNICFISAKYTCQAQEYITIIKCDKLKGLHINVNHPNKTLTASCNSKSESLFHPHKNCLILRCVYIQGPNNLLHNISDHNDYTREEYFPVSFGGTSIALCTLWPSFVGEAIKVVGRYLRSY